MKMTTVTALRNLRYNKRRNLLIGAAICLTTLLLYLVPTIGYSDLQLEFAAINSMYPTWHGIYRSVKQEELQGLQASAEIDSVGLRYDAATVASDDNEIELYYFDEECLKLNRLELESGKLPQAEDEIVVSQGILDALDIEARLGDRIEIPIQIRTEEGLDYEKSQVFKISGFLPTTQGNLDSRTYLGIVSQAFVRAEIPEDKQAYQAYIRLAGINPSATTEELEQKIYQIGEHFRVDRDNVGINDEYLSANYVDPGVLPGILGVMVIIVAAGVITIYSIYYISIAQNIQEFGRLKAVGATRRQLSQVVLKEGMALAVLAVPLGLLLGSLLVKPVMRQVLSSASAINTLEVPKIERLLASQQVSLYHWWIYVLAAAVSFAAVYLSLRKPMRIVGRISTIEAMRFSEGRKGSGRERKGYESLSVPRLVKRNLWDNRKRTAITVLSMGATGIFFIAAATVLSCTTPQDTADNRMPGEYEIAISREEGNKEHPEYAWKEIQKANPLTEELKGELERLEGVEKVDVFSNAIFRCPEFAEEHEIAGLPQDYWKEVSRNIIRGQAAYEDLASGDKVILNKLALLSYPELDVGDTLTLAIEDGEQLLEKEVTIIAIADTPFKIAQYAYLMTSYENLDRLCGNNQNYYYHIQADKKYDQALEAKLQQAIGREKRLKLSSWQKEYEDWRAAVVLFQYLGYSLLAVLGAISLMNLANTMLFSIHSRKKELGILQAMGMSQKQLSGMLKLEGLVYTAGTFLLSLGLGTLAGYGFFLYAKNRQFMNIKYYHFPWIPVLVFVVLMVLTQIIISYSTGRFVKKESLIDRIRFSE